MNNLHNTYIWVFCIRHGKTGQPTLQLNHCNFIYFTVWAQDHNVHADPSYYRADMCRARAHRINVTRIGPGSRFCGPAPD